MAVAQTEAQQAFAARMLEKHITPLWTVGKNLVKQRADAEDPAGVLELPARRAALHPGGRRRDHRGRGAPPRAGAEQPDAQARRHPHAHLRDPAHQGRRDRARAPAFAGGAALHHRGRGRLHRGQRRAHLHEARRLHRHAGLDLARPRQGNRRGDDLARRPRRAAGQSSRRDLLRRLRGRGRLPAVAAAAQFILALRLRHAAARAGERAQFAGVQLSLRAHPRGAGKPAQGQRLGRLPRPEAEVRQSGDRRLGDADDRHLRAAAAQGLPHLAVPLDRGHRRDGGRGHAAGPWWATRLTLCSKNDIFVAPNWTWWEMEAKDDLVLLSYSDRAVLEKLDLWREQRANEPLRL